jgi:transcriptional regulator with XRE-family HTH domain
VVLKATICFLFFMDVKKRLATNMKRLRKERGWSQEALADASGLDRTYISAIERNVKNPTVIVIERVALALECRMSNLLD